MQIRRMNGPRNLALASSAMALALAVGCSSGSSSSSTPASSGSTQAPLSATIVAPATAKGGRGFTAFVPTYSGATYTWTATNGVILDGQGSSAITVQPAMGFSTIHLTCAAVAGSSNSSGSADVTAVLPSATPQTLNTTTSVAVPATLLGSDPFSDPISYQVASAPANGTLSGTAPNFTYTSAVGFAGTDQFTFETVDAYGNTSAPATVAVNVASPAAVFVAASGNDANDGLAIGTPFATIQHAIDSLGTGAYAAITTVVIEPGTYAENLKIQKSVTLRGDSPVTKPATPTVIIKPAVTGSYPPSGTTYGLIDIGASTADSSGKNLVVNLQNLDIDGSNVVGSNTQVRGVEFFYASGSIQSCIIENLGATNGIFGVQDGIPARFWGSDSQPGQWTVQDSILRDFNKQALGARGTGTLTLTGNRMSGQGATGPSQQSQNFLFLWDAVQLKAQNNIFENLGPAGGPNSLIASDGSTGTAIGIVDGAAYYPSTYDGHTYTKYEADRSGLVIQNNTFINCQTIWYDLLYVGSGGASLGAYTNDKILANNTIVGGYISEGPLAESPYMTDFAIMPGSAGTDNMLQYILTYYVAGTYSANEIFISTGAYDLPSDISCSTPVVLRSAVSGQSVTITLPAGSTHANVTAGAGVTISLRP